MFLPVGSGNVKYELRVACYGSRNTSRSSILPLTSSNPRVKSSNPWVTSSNLGVTSSSPRIRRLKTRVARLKAWDEAIKPRVK